MYNQFFTIKPRISEKTAEAKLYTYSLLPLLLLSSPFLPLFLHLMFNLNVIFFLSSVPLPFIVNFFFMLSTAFLPPSSSWAVHVFRRHNLTYLPSPYLVEQSYHYEILITFIYVTVFYLSASYILFFASNYTSVRNLIHYYIRTHASTLAPSNQVPLNIYIIDS